MDPARMFMESLTPGPELENNWSAPLGPDSLRLKS